MLQPYNALCHGFCRNNNAKTTPILRFAQERALKVKPTLYGLKYE